MNDLEQVVEGLIQLSNSLIEQVSKLQIENNELKKKQVTLETTLVQLLENQKTIVETISKNQRETQKLGETMTRSIDNVKYELGMGQISSPEVATIEETVDAIINNRASICRFGDGEFSIMAGASRQGFQRQDDKLAGRLIEVVKSNDDNCLIAVADNYGSLDQYSYMSKNEIRYYMTDAVRKQHSSFLDMSHKYFNAYITTPYMLYADRDTDHPTERFQRLKQIWEKRNIVIIEGRLSRLGVGNDLFNNAKSVVRILGPAEHAFDRYDELLEEATAIGQKTDDVLFVIALGPTATVLAYDIHKMGYQALDLGHIDNDYEYYIHKATDRYAIPGKYVNNITKEQDVAFIKDEIYEKQIIARIY
ncbi:MAG: GT-D fold domain-containing glycosyltransferase [Lachnospiraceae bacterium]|nr:GT-D fold domain-containing glycosyltransferase [Lachnospiraceae bacterium]